MDTNKEKFDFVCSLGGNCMAASQLRQRGLRTFSLPFDWLYIKDEQTLYKLAECFKNNFKTFMLKENMRPVSQQEFPNNGHPDRIFYQDMMSGYYFLNHFDKELDVDNEYEKVSKKIKRRIERLNRLIKKSNRILFLLSSTFEISEDSILFLSNTLKEI